MHFFRSIILGLGVVCTVEFLIAQELPSKDSSDKKQPSATISGRNVTLEPSGASFDIPQRWLNHHKSYKNNLHLTRRELDQVKDSGGEWDHEYCEVVNALFSFDKCEMHAGGEGWGRNAYSYFDVQMRAYVVDDGVDDITSKVATSGVQAAKQLKSRKKGAEVQLKKSTYKEWQRSTLTFELFFDDYGGRAHVDVFARAFDKQTAVLVFMYVKSPFKEFEDVEPIVDSFRWKK